jgi:hypothetical protein
VRGVVGGMYTFLPITPRQAMDGTAVMAGLVVLKLKWFVVGLGVVISRAESQTRLAFLLRLRARNRHWPQTNC